MKRVIFFRIKKRIVFAALSAVLSVAGIVTPVRNVLSPAIAIADNQPSYRVVQAILTAYSSSPDETDDTPYITASGSEARDGVIANNCLPFGTEVRVPDIFGDKSFVVEDRKNSRYDCNWIDVWYPSKEEAKEFGIARKVEVLVFD